MLTYVMFGIAVIVVLFLLFVASRPAEFRVVRSAMISAPPQNVYAYVNDFRKWLDWSPWEGRDPNLKRTYEGPATGPGAIYSWVGNREVGEGRMTILDSRPGELVKIKLEFLKPFKATNTAEFALKPEGSQTGVTWTMTGRNNFMFKAVSLFMNMDKMVGGDFEKGLAQLKSVSESLAAA